MNRRNCAVLVIVIGVIWALAAIGLGLFGKTAAADRLTSDLTSSFSDPAVAQATRDARTVDAFSRQIQDRTVPFLASTLHMKPPALLAAIDQQFPAVARVLSDKNNHGGRFGDHRPYLDHAASYVDTVAAALKANQKDFRSSSDIPASWLPTRTVAWLFLLLGLATVALGVSILRATDGAFRTAEAAARPSAVGVAVVGVVVILAPIVLGLFGKTAALDRLTDSFRPVFVDQGSLNIAEGGEYLTAVRAADKQLRTEVVPFAAKTAGVPAPAVAALLKKNSPVVAKGLLGKDPFDKRITVLTGIVNRYTALATTVQRDVKDFTSTDALPGLGLPAKVIPWLLVLPGLLLVAAAYLLGAFPLELPRLSAAAPPEAADAAAD